MPTASKTPCNKPGCSALTTGRYCGEHNKGTDDRRSSNARGYDSRWRSLSERYRKQHPLCEAHADAGCIVPCDVVDHIIPLHIRPDMRLDEGNLQALCHGCHTIKTAQDVKRYGSATTHRTDAHKRINGA